jgi:hypothetical protein
MHGLKIMFVQMGYTSKFGWATLLLSLVAAQAMLGLAAMFTTIISRFFIKNNQYYNDAMFEQTMDFSDLRDATKEEKAEAEKILPR